MCNKKFAIITGASEGFGKALALECASRHQHLILVALPGSGLKHLAAYIEKNFDVSVYWYEHDLSKKEECRLLFHEINQQALPVHILINNAGMGGTHFFEERDAEYYHKQIELNVVAPTLLTHYFLDSLEKNSPSYILNVSSLASFFYLPKKGVYGGTKSYLVAFSKSLRRELKRKNVFVSTVCPGGMNTTPGLILQHKHMKGLGRWAIMNPENAARVAMDGMFNKKELIIPGYWNRVFMFLDKILPKWIKEMITNNEMKKARAFTNPVNFFMSPLKTAVSRN